MGKDKYGRRHRPGIKAHEDPDRVGVKIKRYSNGCQAKATTLGKSKGWSAPTPKAAVAGLVVALRKDGMDDGRVAVVGDSISRFAREIEDLDAGNASILEMRAVFKFKKEPK